MRMKTALIVMTILVIATVLAAQTSEPAPQAQPRPEAAVKSPWPSAMVFVRYGSFAPSAGIFKTVYGNGPVFGAELRLHIKGGFYLSLEAGSFSKKGRLTVTEDPTTMTIYPMEVMAIFHPRSGSIMPYIGAGGSACKYAEENVIGKVSKWGVGFAAYGGVTARWRSFGIDARVKLSSVKVKPLEERVNLGGMTISIAAGYLF